MNKLYKQINKYLLILGSIFAVIALMLFANLLLIFTPRNTSAEEVGQTSPTSNDLWTNHQTSLTISETGDTYITSAGQFAWLCAQINNTNTVIASSLTGKTFVITQNLDFSSYYWVPMGFGSADNAIRINIKAQNDSIKLKNIFIDNTATNLSNISDFGLFGAIDNCVAVGQGYLNCLQLENIYYKIDVSKVTADTINIGGIAGYFAGQKADSNTTTDPAGILNCGASGQIVITESTATTTDTAKIINVGGLVGQVGVISGTTTGATIKCFNNRTTDTVSITVTGATDTQSTYNIGGVVGQNAGTVSCLNAQNLLTQIFNAEVSSNIGSVGGVVGLNLPSGTVQDVINGSQSTQKTNIIAQSSANSNLTVGGIAGENNGAIENCQNYAGVQSYVNSFGGIAGKNTLGTISKCTNYATVYLDGANVSDSTVNGVLLGGIAGHNANLISECTNKGAVGAGDSITKQKGYLGGIVGESAINATVTNCLNYGKIGANIYAVYAGGIVGNNLGKITADSALSSVSKFTANFGEVIASSVVGGIAGIFNADGGGEGMNIVITLENCYNTGKIYSSSSSEKGAIALGGIVGEAKNSSGSTISNCMNLGEVGVSDDTVREGAVGGIVGKSNDAITIKNCANYAKLAGDSSIGGIVGESTQKLTLSYVLATGATFAKTNNTKLGGIMGTYTASTAIDLTTSVFDLGVMGYDVPETITSTRSKQLYKLPVIGQSNSGQSEFSINNSPLTYYMTASGVSQAGDYYIKSFQNSADWVFPACNESTQEYYYPVPKTFNDNQIFSTSVSTNSDSLQLAYPSQKLSLIKLKNILPIWDSSSEKEIFQTNYINLYPGLVLDSLKDSVIAGKGQYVIQDQYLDSPTKNSAIYLSDNEYTTGDTVNKEAFNTKMNDLGWLGKYNSHQGYESSFKLNSVNGNSFDFDKNAVGNTAFEILICWTPKKIEVAMYEYDYDTNQYKSMERSSTFEYSIDPSATATIDIPTAQGRTYYGWRGTNDLIYTNFADEDEWITAWGSVETTISCNSWEKIILYCMSIQARVELTLNAGSLIINSTNVNGAFSDDATQKIQTIKYGESYIIGEDLPVPSKFSVPDYCFRGYYDNINQVYYMTGDTYCYNGGAIALEAVWTYNRKYIKYVTITADGDFELKKIQVDYNEEIPAESQATETNWSNLFSYQQIDSASATNGYMFAGAYSDRTLKTLFDFTTVILDDTTIYIKWSAQKFMLTLHANIGKDLNGEQRAGGWGDSEKSLTITQEVEYKTDLISYLQNWKRDNRPTSTVSVDGFAPKMRGTGYEWAINPISMGQPYVDSDLLFNSDYTTMPADNLTLYILWEKQEGVLILNANGGNFGDGTTKSYKVLFETKLSQQLADGAVTIPTQDEYIFKWWSETPDGSAVDLNKLMPMNLTLYAVYGEQRKVTFYVLGALPKNIIGTTIVYDGAILGPVSGDVLNNLKSMIAPEDGGQSAFELDYWVKMTYDSKFNIIESTEVFDFATTEINEDINILAKLKPNENYVPPVKDTTNYIIIAGIVIIVALILLFIVLLARPTRKDFNTTTHSRNKDIQAQLDEIRELERRRRNMTDPFNGD